MKALIDRAAFVSIANGDMFQGKVGAAVSVMRRSGGAHAVDTMNHFFLGRKMYIAGMALGVGRNKGEVEKDEEGVQAVKSLGQRMAFLIKKLNQ
jgi:multimeric flavodoxin WrbA